MGTFVALQATSLLRKLLASYQATEFHLAENEFLVREIHHRVKNSLQVVASLVTLQANRIEPGPHREVFHALRRRMTAIALVHEKLHSQGTSGLSDVGSYLRDLLELQYPGDELESGKITWRIDGPPVSVGVDFCIDAGLILTELVANAHKHILVTHRGTHLGIEVRYTERLVFELIDDGPGFPPGFVPEASKGLGFRLVLSLLPRNGGTLTFPEGPGGRVRVELTVPG
jgi:two-component sensor histidine kinase